MRRDACRRALCSTCRPGTPAHISVPWPTTPRWATRLSPPAIERNPTPLGGHRTCCDCRLRCRTATPSRRPTSSTTWIAAAKAELGERLLILGHHYQRDEVIKWADARGDSFKLARFAADNDRATDIVFCGVHFMAESADVLTGDHQRVILPDLNAGCSMADMADIDQVEECWDALADVTDIDQVVPDHLHELVGRAEGVRGRARRRGVHVVERAGGPRLGAGQGRPKVLFFPDQHLGRNTGFDMGYGEDDMRVWNPRFELGGLEERDVKEATLLLWKGHCSVHQRFRPEHVAAFRAEHPDGEVIVHPECAHDVVRARRQGRLDRAHPRLGRAAPRRARCSASAPRSTWCSAWRTSTPT